MSALDSRQLARATLAPPIHANCVALDGRAVLLTGPSGSGKSDLSLRLIDRGWQLVADDYVHIAAINGQVYAIPPTNIAGRIEVRNVGILTIDYLKQAPICLKITLDGQPARLPQPSYFTVKDVEIPALTLNPFEASAPIKVEGALNLYGLRLN